MLNTKEKASLKKYAQQNKILKFPIGKGTIDNNVIEMLNNAIIKHELIKVSFLKSALQSVTLEELVLDLSSGLHCEVVQIIGNTALLYKKNPKLSNSIKL
jgi:RNA-binding protein